MSIKPVMPFNHLTLHHPLLLPPSIFPSIRVFSNESVLRMWSKHWSVSFSISPSNEYSGLISLQSKKLSGVFWEWNFSTVQKHQLPQITLKHSKRLPGGSDDKKNMPATQETQVWSLHREDPLEKGMATHSSILAWRILWTEEPGGPQSVGSQRVRHDWVTNAFTFSIAAELEDLPSMDAE